MNSLDFKLLASHHKKNLIVKNTPYGHCTTNNFFPDNIINNIATSFKFPETVGSTSDPLFQKNKTFT